MTEAPSGRPSVPASAVPDRLRRPIHFGMLLGLSTGLYATTLVGLAVLQQHADDDLAAARAPTVGRVGELRAANDRMASAIQDLGDRQEGLSRSYATVRQRADDVGSVLSELAVLVGDVRGSAAALPQRIVLPALPSSGSVRVKAKAPPTHATTGASGGG